MSKSPLWIALLEHSVTAFVTDLDHYRVGGGLAVETDYIITVSRNKEDSFSLFPDFSICKTYSAFQTFIHRLKQIVDDVHSEQDASLSDVCRMVEYLYRLTQGQQQTRYLGNVNYNYVKALAKQRSMLMNDALEALLTQFPSRVHCGFLEEFASTVETFFLTDHLLVETQQDDNKSDTLHEKEPTITTTTNSNSRNISIDSRMDATPSSDTHSSYSHSRSARSSTVAYRRTRSTKDVLVVASKHNRSSPLVPVSYKRRRSEAARQHSEQELGRIGADATLWMNDDCLDVLTTTTTTTATFPHSLTIVARITEAANFIHHNPFMFVVIVVVCLLFLRVVSYLTVTMDLDIFLLIAFGMFCVGLHTPRFLLDTTSPATIPGTVHNYTTQTKVSQPPLSSRPLSSPLTASNRSLSEGRTMITRRSVVSSSPAQEAVEVVSQVAQDEKDVLLKTMERFPDNAPLGSHCNRWSQPPSQSFRVRGADYLQDRKKIPSDDFLFPLRGVDLLLTDAPPENVASNSSLLDGNLRSVPSFVVNFRLPWGIVLCYCEIPQRFLPFLKARYEDTDDQDTSLEDMTPGDRTLARFLLGTDRHRNQTLKIVPVVVEGPWIVRSVVGGKPAIIGTKMPVHYVYQPEEPGNRHCYLEVDIDVVQSAAARGILSVTRSYCQILTIDLGFVIQGNQEDELPEQMLLGTRLHGLDPDTAPALPPSKEVFMKSSDDGSDGDSLRDSTDS